jgi:Icc protein
MALGTLTIAAISGYIQVNNDKTMDIALQINHTSDEPIELIQITDAHLGLDAGTCLLGVDTDDSLDRVLAEVKMQSQNQLLLCTGDLSNDGSPEAYLRFKDKVDQLHTPHCWLPGNHDERAQMASVLGHDAPELTRKIEIGNWLIVMLDSSVLKRVEGELSSKEMAFLNTSLQEAGDRHVMICLHHHVLPVNCAWLDHQRVGNADQLLMLLEHYPQVKLVVSGHVHQDFSVQYAQFQLITSPSTCIQFAPLSHDFKVDLINPGYRWFKLAADGGIETGVRRLQNFKLTIDTLAEGY